MADKHPDPQTVNQIAQLRTAKAEGLNWTPGQEAELKRLAKEAGDKRGTEVEEDDLSENSPVSNPSISDRVSDRR